MGFTTLGLMLGYGCNARCKSCLLGDMLNKKTRMNVADACSWIDQAHGLGDLMLVGFSGGEPFLYMNEMKAVANYANAKYALPSVAVTNAFWAKTPAKAHRLLQSLYDIGLRRLLVSVDDFHQEWIPLERVRNCLDAAKILGIECTLQCVTTLTSNKLRYYLEALEVSEGDELVATEVPCTPVGSAAVNLSNSEFPVQAGVPEDYCTLLQALIVRPEGLVHLCCGPAFTVEALTAGNLHKEPLEQIIRKAEWNPLFNALALGNGPCHIATALHDAEHDDFLLGGYASSCHACHHILGQPGVEAVLMGELEAQRSELFLKRTILDQISGDRAADILNI